MRALLIFTLALSLAPLAARAQDTTRAQNTARAAAAPPGPRRASLMLGVGNSMGWFGAKGERYFARGRLSAFAGLGATFNTDGTDEYASGVTVAGGVRGYTAGARHRAFLELSISQLAVTAGVGADRYYGPGLQVGYQYTARRWFTFEASVGAGYSPGIHTAVLDSGVQPMAGIAFGYTWR